MAGNHNSGDTNTRESITRLELSIVKEYVATGHTAALNEERQEMLRKCIACYGLLSKYPQRGMCVKHAMTVLGLPETTAREYVDFARQTWGDYMDVSQDFLEKYLINSLLKEISDPKSSEQARAKNLATLERHMANMPKAAIDPSLMEQNNVYIQINAGEKSISLLQDWVKGLPKKQQAEFYKALEQGSAEAEFEEIMEG